MCGIAGILGTDDPADAVRVTAMADIMGHRGPDAGRVAVLAGAVLGHRRLSIIDLSDRGLQPMRSVSGAWLVFNGEIYNYRELKAELAEYHAFTSDSDSEVLLAAWDHWGEHCLDRFNGMFAFCVYDPMSCRAFLARDRFGQKPLYFSQQGRRLLFASEVKALIAAGIAAKPNRAAWARYLVRASYDDTADSLFDGVAQLMPGECATFSPAVGLRVRRYYDVAKAFKPAELSVKQAADAVRSLLTDTARLHMRADVPVGISLSGGLDSSALLACLDQTGELHEGVRCISVDFGGDLSEQPWIEAAARHHGLPFEILPYSPAEFHADITPTMWHLEGPIGGLMNCALNPVMRAAREAGIKVIQDGTGLDEAFAGYRNHHDLFLGTRLRDDPSSAQADLAAYCQNWSTTETAARKAASLALEGAVTAIDGTIAVRPELLAADLPALATEAPYPGTGDLLRDALIDYLQVRKIPRNTRMKDRLSMAYSLELRLPFLDHRLVELALSLPAPHYFLNGRSKSIVREAMEGSMDDGVRTAVKRSIQAPQGAWLRREPMASYIGDLISTRSFAERELFDIAAVQAAFTRFRKGEFDNSFFVWQWINVEEWFRMFVDGNPVAKPHNLETRSKPAPTLMIEVAA